jgi:hypothetical protein
MYKYIIDRQLFVAILFYEDIRWNRPHPMTAQSEA